MGKTVVISGGTDGMGRATALQRLARGDLVTVIGSSEAKGRALLDHAASPNLRFIAADLSEISSVDRVVAEIAEHHDTVDALALFANRTSAKRQETAAGLEFTFALYYLSRYLLGRQLSPLLDASPNPVIINIAGVGVTIGKINWADPQLEQSYSQIRAQIQAGRANDLLGVSFAQQVTGKARYVLYHPGFTRSGIDGHQNPVVRGSLKLFARLFARPVEDSVRPIVDWIDHPPAAPLTAVDRGKPVDLALKTLNPRDAARLAAYTGDLVSRSR